MKWGKVLGKALLGLVVFAVSYLATNPELVVNLVPENIAKMTIGSVVAAIILGVRNWLKNRNK